MRRFAVAVFAGFFSLLWLGFLQPAVAQSQSPSETGPAASHRAENTRSKHSIEKHGVETSFGQERDCSQKGRHLDTAPAPAQSLLRKNTKPCRRGCAVCGRPLSPPPVFARWREQLLQDRTPTAYAGVEAYARRHAKDDADADAAALAWLVIGYARTLDHDYARAIDPFNRAKAGASELGDYVAYYLGDAYLKTGQSAEALSTLADFSKNFPDSLLIRDAHLVYANALIEDGRAQEAAALLEKDRAPVRSDIELAIGRAYEAAGENEKAASAFRNIYFNLPNSFEVDIAGVELRKLGISGSLAERRTRADLLFKAKRYSDAAHDYHDLVAEVSPADRPEIQLALAEALEKNGGSSSNEARHLLTSMGTQTGDNEAQRLYLLSETARSNSDEEAVQRTLDELRQFGPSSPWLEQALLSAGNMYLLKRDYDRAIGYFRELQQRFPNGTHASSAHWKAAWLTFRQGKTDEARVEFEQQIALYPDSGEVPNALYWRARLAEEEGNTVMARAFYQKLVDRFRNYYYAELGRQRLQALPSAGDASPKEGPAKEAALKEDLVHFDLLDRVAPLSNARKIAASDAPDDNLRVARARLLSNGGLADTAVRELQAAASQEDGTWAPPEMARVYQDGGRYDRGIEIMKRSHAQLFRRRYSRPAPPLLGSAFSQSLLGRSAQIFAAQRPRSLSRSIADPAGVRIQCTRSLSRQRRRPDAASAKDWKDRRQASQAQGIQRAAAFHTRREPPTRHALLQRYGG